VPYELIGIIVRLYETFGGKINTGLSVHIPFESIEETNLWKILSKPLLGIKNEKSLSSFLHLKFKLLK
jgi:hypothetical protein